MIFMDVSTNGLQLSPLRTIRTMSTHMPCSETHHQMTARTSKRETERTTICWRDFASRKLIKRTANYTFFIFASLLVQSLQHTQHILMCCQITADTQQTRTSLLSALPSRSAKLSGSSASPASESLFMA